MKSRWELLRTEITNCMEYSQGSVVKTEEVFTRYEVRKNGNACRSVTITNIHYVDSLSSFRVVDVEYLDADGRAYAHRRQGM